MDFYYTVPRYNMTPSFPDIPVVYSAGSWWVKGKLRVPKYRDRVSKVIADCGAYSALSRFGRFPYTWDAYLNWVRVVGPSWFAMWDCPGDPTWTQMFLRGHSDCGGVPTCQGKDPADYRAHARDLTDFPLIGVGNLVRADRVEPILEAILSEHPGARLHLWGVGLGRLKQMNWIPPQVESVDSSSWNGRWGSGLQRYRDGKRNGLTQTDFGVQVMLPEYKAKVDGWLDKRR